MGRRREKDPTRSQTLPPSPSHSFTSSSSSDFEFTISVSPRKSSSTLCPADELFYKGQLLPLHLSPRLSMVRTLLASSSTSSSSDTITTASRDSTGSSTSNESTSTFSSDLVLLADCDSSRPSSVTEDDEFRKLNSNHSQGHSCHFSNNQIKKSRYFSLARFSSVFKKEPKSRVAENVSGNSVKRMSTTAKEVIRKYMKKVKPLYEKLSQKQQQQQQQKTVGGSSYGDTGGITANSNTTSSFTTPTCISFSMKTDRSVRDHSLEVSPPGSNKSSRKENSGGVGISHSFSGNLRYPRRRSCVSSCPSSMRSSPSHSGMLSRSGYSGISNNGGRGGGSGLHTSDSSTMEELQSAIQGAIAHCKNSMNKGLISNEI